MSLEGFFTDGSTALRHAVRVEAHPDRLQIRDAQGGIIDEWSLADLRLVEEIHSGQPVRFSHQHRGDARLTLLSSSALDAFVQQAPQLRKRRQSGTTKTRLILGLSALVILLASLVLGIPYLARPLARAVPAAWETSLGEQVIAAIALDKSLCSSQAGQNALNRLAGNLVAHAEIPYPYRVQVIRSDEVNAFAAPGGRIVLFDGLIQTAQSPEEVAGVLAHEMAHATERHPMEGLIRATGLQVIVSTLVGDLSGLAAGVAGFGETLLSNTYSRADEAEADRIGITLLRQAGIRADGLTRFFQRMRQAENKLPKPLMLLSTHPSHAERIALLGNATPPGGREALTSQEWHDLRYICASRGKPGA